MCDWVFLGVISSQAGAREWQQQLVFIGSTARNVIKKSQVYGAPLPCWKEGDTLTLP